jgi:hypothetical protein
MIPVPPTDAAFLASKWLKLLTGDWDHMSLLSCHSVAVQVRKGVCELSTSRKVKPLA